MNGIGGVLNSSFLLLSNSFLHLFVQILLLESIRNNPEKYCSLIYDNMPSMTGYDIPNYPFFYYGQQYYQPNYYDLQTKAKN
jgi:hypothetical protein